MVVHKKTFKKAKKAFNKAINASKKIRKTVKGAASTTKKIGKIAVTQFIKGRVKLFTKSLGSKTLKKIGRQRKTLRPKVRRNRGRRPGSQ